MPKFGAKNPPVTREGRRLSVATAWWFDNHPRAYTLYCTHNVSLKDECKKCKNG
jgi:hypothetical protein